MTQTPTTRIPECPRSEEDRLAGSVIVRRKGLLDYNRHRLWVFPPALAEWLKLNNGDSGRTAPPEQAVRRKPPNSEARGLSRREIQIMELVADGLRNKEIADRLRLARRRSRIICRACLRSLQ